MEIEHNNVKTVLTNLFEMENGPNNLFLIQKKVQKESGLTVTSIYGSILYLINVRSPSKVWWTPLTVYSNCPHINVPCIAISFYTFAFIQAFSVNLV